jgi:hypothetical protein
LSNLPTVTNTATSSVVTNSGSYVNGPLARKLIASIGTEGTSYLFPVGTNAAQFPLQLINVNTGTISPVMLVNMEASGTKTADGISLAPAGTAISSSSHAWSLQVTGGDFFSSNVKLFENTPTPDNTYVIGFSTDLSGAITPYTSLGGSNVGSGYITSSARISNGSLPAFFAIGSSAVRTLYSYQSGDWDDAATWTLDPSGTTPISPSVPSPGDNVVVLKGRMVTIASNPAAHTISNLFIETGATVDLGSTPQHTFTTLVS